MHHSAARIVLHKLQQDNTSDNDLYDFTRSFMIKDKATALVLRWLEEHGLVAPTIGDEEGDIVDSIWVCTKKGKAAYDRWISTHPGADPTQPYTEEVKKI